MRHERFEGTDYRYPICTYGIPHMQFRGPECDRSEPHLVYFGGAETFGRFMANPFPDQIGRKTGYGTVNLGVVNGGLEFYTNCPEALAIANASDGVVIEVQGAAQLTNAYFKVHPRRNDRVLTAFENLAAQFPELDLFEVHFIRHFLQKLQTTNPEKFEQICAELQRNWVTQMHNLLDQIHVPVHLVWIAPHRPSRCKLAALADDPLFVDLKMMKALVKGASSITQIVCPRTETPQAEFQFSEFDRPAVDKMLGQQAHAAVAHDLIASLT